MSESSEHSLSSSSTATKPRELYVERFMLDPAHIQTEGRDEIIKQLVQVDMCHKYSKMYKITRMSIVHSGDELMIVYSFLGKPGLSRYKDSVPVIKEPRTKPSAFEELLRTISPKALDTTKLNMTFLDPVTGKHFFQTHTGKAFEDHFGIGKCPEKIIEHASAIVVRECDHEFKTVEQQTRSGDEEVTVYTICTKCNMHKKDTLKTSAFKVPDRRDVDKVEQCLLALLENRMNEEGKKDLRALARLVASLDEFHEENK